MFNVAILVENELAHSIFSDRDLEFLGSFAKFNPIDELPAEITLDFMKSALKDADACITCWRTPAFTDELLAFNPKLRFIMHAAGSVRHLVSPSFWRMQGRHISSNAPVIAEDVSQTVLALMITSLKQIWAFGALTREGNWLGGEHGVFSTKRLDDISVGVIGASLVGKAVINILRPFKCKLRVSDPYLSPIEADMLGVETLPIDELLKTSDVITLHAPASEDCRHIINKNNIGLIKDGALLINTARGTLIEEPALIEALSARRFFACLDVTDPEPPAKDHPFRTMPNVLLTPHIAGGHTVNGRKMLGANAIKEVYNYLIKGVIAYEVRGEMLGHMA